LRRTLALIAILALVVVACTGPTASPGGTAAPATATAAGATTAPTETEPTETEPTETEPTETEPTETQPTETQPTETQPTETEPAATDGASPGETGAASPGAGFAACGNQDAGDAVLIGGVTDVGQLEDKSFNEAGWCGTIKGADAVGGSADVIVTRDPADYATNMQTLIDQGYTIIVTYGFALGNATTIAAKANPEVSFIGIDQFICITPEGDPDTATPQACAGDPATLLPNYQGLVFAEAQAGYLAGIVAGSLTETNVIGAVGGIITVPPVPQYIGGYHNGALSVNPDVEALIQYVSTDITVAFNDPATGRSIAEQMIQQDADFIFQVAGLSGQGALEAACDAGIWGIGVDVDQALSLPQLAQCIITSAEKKLVDSTAAAIERVVDGTAVGGNVFLDAASDPPGIGLAPFHEHEALITTEIQTAVDNALQQMAAGTLDPCAGPGECAFDPDSQ
jgi:basic membrane protein A